MRIVPDGIWKTPNPVGCVLLDTKVDTDVFNANLHRVSNNSASTISSNNVFATNACVV